MSYRKFAALALITLAGTVQAEQICRRTTTPSAMQKKADGTVIDPRTSLQWQACAYGAEGTHCEKGAEQRLSLMQAQDLVYRINQKGFNGHRDWRLPTVKELETLVSRDCVNPAIDLKLFPNTPGLWFWTASQEAGDQSSAWYVNFRSGFPEQDDRNLANPIRLVRTQKGSSR